MGYSQSSVFFRLQSKFNPDLFSMENEPLEAMEWVMFMEIHLQAFKEVSETEKIVFLTGNLEGSARTASLGAPRTTAEAFLDWFKGLYCSNLTSVSVYSQFDELKQTGSLREYIVEFKRLVSFNNYLPPSVPSAVLSRQFLKGHQNPALRRALEHVRFSPEEETNGTMMKEIMRRAETWVSRGVYSEYSHNPALNPNIPRARRVREIVPVSSSNQQTWRLVPPSQQHDESSWSRQQNYSGSADVTYLPPHRRSSMNSYQHDSKNDSLEESAEPAAESDDMQLDALMFHHEQPSKPIIGWKEFAPASACRKTKERGHRY